MYMMKLNIVCVDTLKEGFNREAQKEYLKRLRSYADVTVCEVSPSRVYDEGNESLITAAMEKEGKGIIKKLIPGITVAMCIEGDQMSSTGLSEFFDRSCTSGKSAINFVIGGSYGLSSEVKEVADIRMSMSKMTFPHELARVVLLEQCYRALTIMKGVKYHK